MNIQILSFVKSVLPISAGDFDIVIPADFINSILSSAPPLPPDMIAPACPILLPGGAVKPATKPTVGFFTFDLFKNSAASSSAEPPISPMITMDFVSSSLKKRSRQSIKFVPFIGSPQYQYR